MRDLSSTVWGTLLSKASSPEADSAQKQTQTNAEQVRQEGRGHARGPPFVRAHLGLIKSLQQRTNTVGTRTATSLSTCWARLEPLSPDQICDEVRICRLDKTYKATVHRVLEALGQTEAERKYGRAPPTAMERELQVFLEDLPKT